MELEKYRRYSEMARGLRPAETVFRGAKVFMSRTGEFVDGDVAVADGVILGVGEAYEEAVVPAWLAHNEKSGKRLAETEGRLGQVVGGQPADSMVKVLAGLAIDSFDP